MDLDRPRRGAAATAAQIDRGLWARWRDGDRRAGEELVRRHLQSLYRFFASKCVGPPGPLVERTLAACAPDGAPRGDPSFRTYLFTLACAELRRHLEAHAGDRALDVTTTSFADLAPAAAATDRPSRRTVAAALQALTIQQQTLLELSYWEDLELAELAAVFATPPGTVRIWLYRARQALRARLGLAPPLRGAATDRPGRDRRRGRPRSRPPPVTG